MRWWSGLRSGQGQGKEDGWGGLKERIRRKRKGKVWEGERRGRDGVISLTSSPRFSVAFI